MKLYGLFWFYGDGYSYSGTACLGVYSSYEKATEAVEQVDKTEYYEDDHHSFTIYEVCVDPAIPQELPT